MTNSYLQKYAQRDAKRVALLFSFYCPTILLLTSSSMALTNSAALGVSELDGRTDRREEVYVTIER